MVFFSQGGENPSQAIDSIFARVSLGNVGEGGYACGQSKLNLQNELKWYKEDKNTSKSAFVNNVTKVIQEPYYSRVYSTRLECGTGTMGPIVQYGLA